MIDVLLINKSVKKRIISTIIIEDGAMANYNVLSSVILTCKDLHSDSVAISEKWSFIIIQMSIISLLWSI